jgi:uncharacterized protein DUF2877
LTPAFDRLRMGGPAGEGPIIGFETRARRISRWVTDRLARRGPWTAVVVSVHGRVLNLRLESGELVCLGAVEVPLVANGLSVDLPPEITLWRLGLETGQPATLSRTSLWVPAAKLRVRFADACRWEPRPRSGRTSPSELRCRAERVRGLAMAEGASAGLLPLLWPPGGAGPPAGPARAAALPAEALAAAAAAVELDGVRRAAGRLAGLGPGLTPSGDDYLAGFAATWVLAREALGQGGRERDRVPAALAAGARSGASPLGHAWIAHAARGEVAEPMGRLFVALLGGEPAGLVPATRGVLGLGATSGTDWMVGALASVQAVLVSTEPGIAWN